MWSDRETELDLLNISHLVDTVISVVKQENLLPATIGVYGDWGSGKSSLLRIVKSELEKVDDILCISFNGWLFEGYEDAKTAIMGTILDEIKEKRTLGAQAQEIFLNLVKKVDWLRIATSVGKQALTFAVAGPAGFALNQLLTSAKDFVTKGELTPEKITDFLKEASDNPDVRRGIKEFNKEFAELLDKTSIKTLVVFIDDLDRCTPDTIIETLEAIRLFLFAPKTAFIIGADERLVRYAVRRRFPELPGERVEVGRDYLEKLIQYPVRIPPLGRVELETYIKLLFTCNILAEDKLKTLCSKVFNQAKTHFNETGFNSEIVKEALKDIPPELNEGIALAEQLAPILTSGLSGNPRQTKRFLNTLIMRCRMAETRGINLKKQVLAKLMLLEYFQPELFKQLAEYQANQEGKPVQLSQVEASVKTVASGSDPEKEIKNEFDIWLKDKWVQEWLSSEPFLADIDLRPYFYFSRDSLGPMAATMRRVSTAAQEILNKLLSESQALQQKGFEESTSLSPADSAAIFEVLTDRLKRQEDLSAKDSVLPIIIGLVDKRRELLTQLSALINQIPDSQIPIGIIPKLDPFGGDFIIPLLKRWSTSTINKGLAQLSKRRLENLNH